MGLTTTILDLLIPAFTGLPDGLSFNLDDEGKVVYAPATEEYKEFLKYADVYKRQAKASLSRLCARAA